MNKYIFIFYLCVLFGCKSEIKKEIEVHQNTQELIHEKLKIDTTISVFPNVVNGFYYCDLVKSTGFKLIKPKPYYVPNTDSLSYHFNIDKDTIVFSYQFSATKEGEDRKIIMSGKPLHLKRIFIKDSIEFNFTGFMSDYRNAKLYSNKNFILIKSQPTQWTGLVNQYEFYQLIDRSKKIAYEFFVNEYYGCE